MVAVMAASTAATSDSVRVSTRLFSRISLLLVSDTILKAINTKN